MAGYYRLNELGFRLASGAFVIRRAAFEPVEAATRILEQARLEAARIVGEAHAAFEDEKRRGYREGLEQAELDAVARVLNESAILDARLIAAEAELSAIVVQAVRRLVDGFDDRSKAEALVRTALRQMRREKRAELRVSPEQFPAMREAIRTIVADYPEVATVDVVEDETLRAPRIVLETAVGRVDGDLGRALDDLSATIMAAARAGVPASEPVA